MVDVGNVQLPQVRFAFSTGPLAVTVPSPLVRVPLTVDALHVSSVSPSGPGSFSFAEVPDVRLKSTVVLGHLLADAHDTSGALQRTLADAVPAPMNAIRAPAATAARASI